MAEAGNSAPPTVRFGTYEADLHAGELRKNGHKIRLDGQPFRILALLLARPGQLVTREELKQSLWPADTFVDFEVSINAAVKRLRHALADSADTPRFIETLPRRGYRFIYPVTPALAQPAIAPVASRKQRFARLSVSVLLLAGILAAAWVGISKLRPGPQPDAPIRSIAVLPLANLTGDPQQEYLADGVHDELIAQLAQGGSLKVISRTSVLTYKQQKATIPEIAHRLGVDGIVEGTVRRAGDRLHITVQLISARDDRHLWAQSYDGELGNTPALVAEVVRGVTYHLNLDPVAAEQLRPFSKKPVDPAVYIAYLKGVYAMQTWKTDNLHQAIGFFLEAVDRDPGFAPAWAKMGECYESLADYAGDKNLPRREAVLRAKAALGRAVELDPSLRQPHQVLGRIHIAEWDWEGAAREFERARQVDPAYPGFPTYLLLTGRFDEAVEVQRKNAELNPLDYSAQLTVGYCAFRARRYQESISALKKTVNLNPNIHHAHYELAWNYAKTGRYTEAIAECEQALVILRRTRPDAIVATGCGWVYAVAGRRREALAIAHQLEQAGGGEEKFIQVAHIYDALGQRERALALLERAFQARSRGLPQQWLNPMVSDELRSDPRFQDILRRTAVPSITLRREKSFASVGKQKAGTAP